MAKSVVHKIKKSGRKIGKYFRSRAAEKEKWAKVFHTDESPLPKRLLVATTYECSAFCPHCYLLQQNRNVLGKPVFMEDDLFLSIMNSSYVEAIDRVGFVGGEALLNDRIFDWFDILAQRNIAEVSVSSNGISLLNDQIVDRLLNQSVLTHFNLSLDATTQKGFCRARGIKDFDFEKLCRHISRLAEHFRNGPTFVTASFVVKQLTPEVLNEMARFGKELNLQRVRLFALHIASGKTRGQSARQIEKDYLALEKSIVQNTSYDIDLWIQRPFVQARKRFFCPSLEHYLCVGADGVLAPCCHMPWEEKYGSFRNANGNPINHPHIKSLRQQFITAARNNNADLLPEPCRLCNKRAPDILFYQAHKKKWTNC